LSLYILDNKTGRVIIIHVYGGLLFKVHSGDCHDYGPKPMLSKMRDQVVMFFFFLLTQNWLQLFYEQRCSLYVAFIVSLHDTVSLNYFDSLAFICFNCTLMFFFLLIAIILLMIKRQKDVENLKEDKYCSKQVEH